MSQGAHEEKGKLFLGGLNMETTASSLKEYFSQYGTLKENMVKFDQNGKSRGFGFITYEDPAVADKVLADKDTPGHYVDKKKVDVKKAFSMNSHPRTKKIFVGGVPPTFDKEKLEDYFKVFGEIEELALVTDKATGMRRRGFVFVTYVSEDSVEKVMENTFHTIEDIKVECKRAKPREQTDPNRDFKGHGGHQQQWRGQPGGEWYPPGFGPGYYNSYFQGFGYPQAQQQAYGPGGYGGGGPDGYGGGGPGGYGGYGHQQGGNYHQADQGHGGNWKRQNDQGHGGGPGYKQHGPIRSAHGHSPQSYHPYPRP